MLIQVPSMWCFLIAPLSRAVGRGRWWAGLENDGRWKRRPCPRLLAVRCARARERSRGMGVKRHRGLAFFVFLPSCRTSMEEEEEEGKAFGLVR